MPFAIDEQAMGELKVLDPAKPPVKSIPKAEFPKMVYDHKRSKPGRILVKTNQFGDDVETHVPEKLVCKIVENKHELDAAIKAGFQLKPPVFEPVEPIEIEDGK